MYQPSGFAPVHTLFEIHEKIPSPMGTRTSQHPVVQNQNRKPHSTEPRCGAFFKYTETQNICIDFCSHIF